MSFEAVEKFEKEIAKYFGSPFSVATDSCTHALELCLRYQKVDKINVPVNTYLSVPFLANKLSVPLEWRVENWKEYYFFQDTNIADAAVMWREGSYVPDTLMCLSFQYKKHLNLGRGGMILTDDPQAASDLKKMSYDGRLPNVPWREQDIDMIGYHYYMTPETAKLGLEKLPLAIETKPKKWTVNDWPDLTKMEIFKT
jgi:dTDP-4-amino-4,6-dideoxygalactose transaminase